MLKKTVLLCRPAWRPSQVASLSGLAAGDYAQEPSRGYFSGFFVPLAG